MSDLGLSILLVASGLGVLGLRRYTDRSERGRTVARDFYRATGYLLPTRTFLATAPVAAASLVVWGLGMLGPRPVAFVSVWVGLGLLFLSFLLGYRAPQPFMAGWMRQQIESGRLPMARAHGLDWALFLMLLVMGAAGLVAMPALVLFS